MRASQRRVRQSNAQSTAEASTAEVARPDAAAEFRFDLIDRFGAGKLEPVDLATIAFKATKAGARGAEDLGVDPQLKGDNHARVVRDALGLNAVKNEVLFECRIPLWDANIAARRVRPMLVKLPHEALARDFYNNKSAYLKARSDPDNIDVPAFLDHPITQQFGKSECWPVGYYTDKVKLGNESFYRGSVKCTVMRSSITCWVFKCSELCRCGCNGLCTMDALQMEMNHSLNALQRDVFMESRFDKMQWLPSEGRREARAGRPIGFRGVVNEYRADLPERCAAARVKQHAGHYGCLSCLQKSLELFSGIEAVSLASCPWVLRTQEQYLDELSTHLVAVNVRDLAERGALVAALHWPDTYPWGCRVKGAKGARWGLRAGDQLIVSDALRNPHDLGCLEPPFKVFFFRPRLESGIVGVSLLFNIPGVHTFGIDGFEIVHFAECTLHTLDLGIAQRYCATTMVKALRANIYNLVRSARLVQRGSLRMAKDIKQYYAAERQLDPWKKLSTLSKTFSWRHLGKVSKPCLKAKGGQTRCLVKFCTGLMQKHDCGESGRLLAKAGENLMDMYHVMEIEPRVMSLQARQRLLSAMVNHVVLYRAAGGHLVYKHHGGIHMTLMAGWLGNPRHVSTYEDEHENGIVAKVGLHVHGLTFSKSIFERIELQNPQRKMLPVLP